MACYLSISSLANEILNGIFMSLFTKFYGDNESSLVYRMYFPLNF